VRILRLMHHGGMRGGWVYIMTNKPHGVLYTGVAAHIVARVAQHREGTGSAFCHRYNLTRLVYAEPHPTDGGGDKLDRRSVMVKILSSEDDETRHKIIKATNSQNAVQPTTLRATNKI
jgi:hypothetical protein